MDKKDILSKLRENKETLFHKFGVKKIGLYGSFSKDCQNENSDIDIIYELNEDKKLDFGELLELEAFCSNLFGNYRVELVNAKFMNPIIKIDMENSVLYV